MADLARKKGKNTKMDLRSLNLGVLIQEMREKKQLTQQQLAEKCGTTKSYISRIENDAADIRLSTLVRILSEGLGGRLSISMNV